MSPRLSNFGDVKDCSVACTRFNTSGFNHAEGKNQLKTVVIRAAKQKMNAL